MKHFTIILPTRNRADTLYWTIKNCLSQDYERMTLLVSDNCSSDHTPEVLASFHDRRLTVIKTPAPTSMSANIEFALAHCVEVDTFVLGIGDDDGLLPGGLSYASEVLGREPEAEALVWCASTYCWPDNLIKEWRNGLHLSVGEEVRRLQSDEMLAKLCRCEVFYQHLPALWNSLVSSTVLRRCLKQSGRFIIGSIPDAASAVRVACATPSYLYSQRSVALTGSSSHSNGIKEAVGDRAATAQFYSENTIAFNRRMVPSPSAPGYCAESLWMAHDQGLLPAGFVPDMPRVVRLMLLRQPTMTDPVYAAVTDAARKIAGINGIAFDREAMLRQNESENAAHSLFQDPVVMEGCRMWSLNCDPRLTGNIHEAANLAGELFRAHRDGRLLIPAEHRDELVALKHKLKAARDKSKKLEERLADASARREAGLLCVLRDKWRKFRHRPRG